jgi:RNA polymerase sigma-70 factor (ECF subfamily)
MHRGSGAPLLLPSSADSLVASGPLPRTRRTRSRSERALICGALAGSQADLEVLFRAHWPRAYRAAYLIVHDHAAAEDIAQEAFVQAIRRLDRFDRRRRFAPWLGAIVANRSIDWLRARTARRESGQEPPDTVSAADLPTGTYSEEVLAALASLSPEHRAVVVMRYVLEYTPGEIAGALDLPRGTVNSRLRRGLDALESRLEKAERP